MADFPAGKIYVFQYESHIRAADVRAELPRSAIKDCYNLMFNSHLSCWSDIALKNDSSFSGRIQQSLKLGIPKHFTVGRETSLYFTRWFEDPDYREETVLFARWPTGEIAEVIPAP